MTPVEPAALAFVAFLAFALWYLNRNPRTY